MMTIPRGRRSVVEDFYHFLYSNLENTKDAQYEANTMHKLPSVKVYTVAIYPLPTEQN